MYNNPRSEQNTDKRNLKTKTCIDNICVHFNHKKLLLNGLTRALFSKGHEFNISVLCISVMILQYKLSKFVTPKRSRKNLKSYFGDPVQHELYVQLAMQS